jgi:hypothetical protein
MTALARSKKETFSGFTNDSAQPPTALKRRRKKK